MSVTYAKGVGIASGLAGPLFLLAYQFTPFPAGPMTMIATWPIALAVLVASVPVGFALAIAPNWLGTALLAALGQDNDGVRLPVFWALIGAGVGGAADLALAASGGTASSVPLFTPTALACALLARAGTRWQDQEIAR